jgi:hypothetical protein
VTTANEWLLPFWEMGLPVLSRTLLLLLLRQPSIIFLPKAHIEYKNYFNAYAVKVISAESGVKHPGTATDVTEPVIPVTNLIIIWVPLLMSMFTDVSTAIRPIK